MTNKAPNSEFRRQTVHQTELSKSLRLPDLESDVQASYNQLPIERSYFENATHAQPATDDSKDKDADMMDDMHEKELRDSLEAWDVESKHEICPIPDGSLCHRVMMSVTTLNRGMNRAAIDRQNMADSNNNNIKRQPVIYSTSEDTKDTVIPSAFLEQLKETFMTCIELLKHYWSCFPVAPSTQKKMERMKDALNKEYESILKWRQQLYASQQASLVQLLQPLMNSIEKTDSAYEEFKRKEADLKARMQARDAQRLASASAVSAVK